MVMAFCHDVKPAHNAGRMKEAARAGKSETILMLGDASDQFSSRKVLDPH